MAAADNSMPVGIRVVGKGYVETLLEAAERSAITRSRSEFGGDRVARERRGCNQLGR